MNENLGKNLRKILQSFPIISICSCRKYRPSHYAAERLLTICSRITDSKTEISCWHWTPEDVAEWVANELFYPELKEVFIENEIDGQGLIFLTADKFPKMNIKRFDVIKELTAKIRKLCKLDQDEVNRSISLPPENPLIIYLWYKAKRTGPTAYFMTLSKYLKETKIIREEIADKWKFYAILNHWNRIPSFMPWCPCVIVGANRRINPMTGTQQRLNFNSKDHPYLLKDLCIYHIPCNNVNKNLTLS